MCVCGGGGSAGLRELPSPAPPTPLCYRKLHESIPRQVRAPHPSVLRLGGGGSLIPLFKWIWVCGAGVVPKDSLSPIQSLATVSRQGLQSL